MNQGGGGRMPFPSVSLDESHFGFSGKRTLNEANIYSDSNKETTQAGGCLKGPVHSSVIGVTIVGFTYSCVYI